MSRRKNNFNISRLAFWLSVAFVIFFMGGEFAVHNWQPWKIYVDGYRNANTMIKQSLATYPELLAKKAYSGDGVERFDVARAYEGFTLMQGWFSEGLEIRLVDMYGNVVHRWPLDFFKIWEDQSHIPATKLPATKFNTFSQGMWLQRDGSVIFNLKGLVKLDKCGNVIWKLGRRTHHSVTQDQDGSFWVPAYGDEMQIPDDLLLPGVTRKKLMSGDVDYEDHVLHVSADGKILQEFSVLQALVDGGFNRELFDVRLISNTDPTHLNDIELVTPELASKIDGVVEGDFLVSLRQLHLIAIMDRKTGDIKWHHTGPWIRQHDPDITQDGNIEVFNNNNPYWVQNEANPKHRSNITSLDPTSGITDIVYPRRGQSGFFTEIMGSKQRLPNGNMLIVETMNGRVFEIDNNGEIEWEYIKQYDEEHASLITHAVRYSHDYLGINSWDCSQSE